ncbi:alpha/beta fold hydrolase (plasmid) [Deinococcus metallilatus]|uniref:Alpha/beta fold hydrolase n=1 Tax=Deinococcus metallilatus TaxID=1211322 RepID=A0AAJ5K019_9DEIO|nr:alpha/beta fold hydrolase [Deinococcus metallilatus]MBB5297374.1 pimeloyl-ACP methyl ester carboxylesterase [Deinococcus metallilatus]QBY06939.1 alpha/beta fold hydrolase [Deinococcus metallilatus]TLK32329.1 alpha/beta fold hydrolase [Deinococcus metallilatus]GMA17079.1 hydrolase [Deinococcus metallilatus]
MSLPPPPPRSLTVGDIRTRFAVQGEGPPVLLLHGIGRSLEDWSETLGPLARGQRVYALDLIGFGYTDKPDVPYTLAGLARFAAHFLDAVGETRPVTLIGNSLGGAVAQQFAVQFPERTRALVLVNSAGFGPEVAPVLRALAVPHLGELLLRPTRWNARQTVRSLFHAPALVTEERVAQALDLARQPGAARAFLRVLRDLGDWRGAKAPWRAALHGPLAARRVPTLIVWGDRDRILPAAHLAAARERQPHARTHLFPRTGHMPQLERPGAFNRLVLDFLQEVPA